MSDQHRYSMRATRILGVQGKVVLPKMAVGPTKSGHSWIVGSWNRQNIALHSHNPATITLPKTCCTNLEFKEATVGILSFSLNPEAPVDAVHSCGSAMFRWTAHVYIMDTPYPKLLGIRPPAHSVFQLSRFLDGKTHPIALWDRSMKRFIDDH